MSCYIVSQYQSRHSKGWAEFAYLHFAVNGIATADAASSRTSTIVTPACATLTIRTITSHVTCVTADTTNDARRKVLALWTIVLAVTDLTTVLTSLILVVSKGTVEGSQLTELVSLELVLTFGDRCSLNIQKLAYEW